MYGGGKLFTYGFNTSELGETASYALLLLVLISASVLIIEFQAACGIWLRNFDLKKEDVSNIFFYFAIVAIKN